MWASPFEASTISNGTVSRIFSTSGALNLRPISRLTAYSVLAELVTAWRFAIWPTSLSSLSVKPTTDGVVRPPSLFEMICTVPFSRTETQQLVVPRSIPITLLMCRSSFALHQDRRCAGPLLRYLPVSFDRKPLDVFVVDLIIDIIVLHGLAFSRRNFRGRFAVAQPFDLQCRPGSIVRCFRRLVRSYRLQ